MGLEALRPACIGRQNRRRKAKPTRSRTRWRRTATGPMPVTISRSGKCPWRTTRWRPSAVSLSAWSPRKPATSASTACANSAHAMAQNLINGSVNVPGWESLITLSWVAAYHSFSGEVEASNTPTIRRLTPSSRHQLPRIAHLTPEGWRHVLVPRAGGEDCSPAR